MAGRRRFLTRTLQALAATGLSIPLRPEPLAALAATGEHTMETRLTDDLRGWDDIEDHRTGSHGDARTAAWLADRVRACGVTPEVTAFEFERRIPEGCFVGSAHGRFPGVPLFDGPATAPAGISGRLGALDDDAPIALIPFEPFAGHPQTRALQAAREAGRHRAIVALSAGATVRPGLALLNADRYGDPFGPPVLQVATEHGAALRELAAAGATVTVATPMRAEATTVSNVQARVAGTRGDLAPLVIMTPRSAWWTCTAERGGGIAVWLEAVRRWSREAPQRDLLFTANTGHELGHVGLERYLHDNPALVRDAHAWLHLGANFAAAGGQIRYQASDSDLMHLGLTAIAGAGLAPPDITPVDERPLGEARNVFDGGGRYVSLLGSNPLFHHPDDRWPLAVDLDRTMRLTHAMLEVIARLVRA